MRTFREDAAGGLAQQLGQVLPRIHSMGTKLFEPIWAIHPHSSTRNEILYVLEGEAELVFGAQRWKAGPGDLAVVPAHTEHRDEFEIDRSFKPFLVFFTWALSEPFFACVDNGVLSRMSASAGSEVRRMLDHLMVMDYADNETDRMVAESLLLSVLLLMYREGQRLGAAGEEGEGGERRKEHLVAAAKAYVEQNFHRPISLDEVADALRVSTFYLSHVFSSASDFSLFAYLTNLRMQKARALLAEGRLNVSEVAGAVGYGDASYFSKIFRKRYGKSPRDVLRQKP